MFKWIIGVLVVFLLVKRNSVPDSVTTAAGAPPEGNISSWGNQGSINAGTPDSQSFPNATQNNSSKIRPVGPVHILPSVLNFRTRGYYNGDTRYNGSLSAKYSISDNTNTVLPMYKSFSSQT